MHFLLWRRDRGVSGSDIHGMFEWNASENTFAKDPINKNMSRSIAFLEIASLPTVMVGSEST